MNCDDAAEFLSAQLDGELTDAETEPLSTHLVQCESCRQLQQRMQQLEKGFKRLPEQTAPSLRLVRPRSASPRWPWLCLLAAAAALLLVVIRPRLHTATFYLAERNQLLKELPLSKSVSVGVFESGPLYGKLPSESDQGLHFELHLEGHHKSCKDLQMEVSYDFDGDASRDRHELYHSFSTDDQEGWEVYSDQAGLISAQGPMRDFTGGRVTATLLNAPNHLELLQGRSRLTLPHDLGFKDRLQAGFFSPFATQFYAYRLQSQLVGYRQD